MKRDTSTYKEALLKEKEELEERLGHLGRQNPNNPADYETTYSETKHEEELNKADPLDRANDIEEYEMRNAVEVPLEERYKSVLDALTRIENHTYGWCELAGESHEIEAGRLEINPAARTCVAHKDIAL